MPVHKFINPQRSSNLRLIEKTKVILHDNLDYPPKRVGDKIIVYAQKDMKMICDPKLISLGIGASITQSPISVSLPQELRHHRLGLINSSIAESCDDIIVLVGLFPEAGSRSTREPHVLIQKGTPLCILMM